MRGSIRQRSKGSWQIRYDSPRDADGRRSKGIVETIKGSKKNAERVLRERLATIESGGYVPKNKETVLEFMDRWLTTYALINVSQRTLHGYSAYVDRYIGRSNIGGIPIQQLSARHIELVYSDMLARGLSHTTVNQLHRILKHALAHGVRWGVLVRNPADGANPPRLERKHIKMWGVEEINLFLDAARGSRFDDFYRLAVLTGMRRSELAGLKWENINLAAGRLSIIITLQRIPGLGLIESPPKTARSTRSISLGQEAVDLLRSIHGRQIVQELEYGPLWRRSGFVFTQPDGSPTIPDKATQAFPEVVRRAGLPAMNLHGLRHAHATLLLTAGVHPKVVSERLGHTNIAITMDTYSHVIPALEEGAASVVEELLRRPSRDQGG